MKVTAAGHAGRSLLFLRNVTDQGFGGRPEGKDPDNTDDPGAMEMFR